MTRVKNVLLYLGLVFVAYVFVTRLGGCLAHADAGTSAPADPTVQKFGWWGAVLAVYVAVRWFLKKNETEHWLARGRWLSIATAVLSVIGSIVGWRFGMDPEVITFAIAGAVPLAIPSTVNASAAKT